MLLSLQFYVILKLKLNCHMSRYGTIKKNILKLMKKYVRET